MRIGFYGGSFDPPHRAHLRVALEAQQQFALSRVLLTPTGHQPLKPEGPTAGFADRLAMMELLCAGHPGLEASAVDAPHPDGGPNYTADTLQRLAAELPAGTRLFAIAGADSFLSLPRWRDPERLFALADWIVVSRPGIPHEALEAVFRLAPDPSRLHRLDTLADPTSATDLRTRLSDGEACDSLLPRALCDYIDVRGLYRG